MPRGLLQERKSKVWLVTLKQNQEVASSSCDRSQYVGNPRQDCPPRGQARVTEQVSNILSLCADSKINRACSGGSDF